MAMSVEARISELHQQLESPEISRISEEVTRIAAALESIEGELAEKYERWEVLEAASEGRD